MPPLENLALGVGFRPAAIFVLAPAGRDPSEARSRGVVTVAVPVDSGNVNAAIGDKAIDSYLAAGAFVVFACRSSTVAAKFEQAMARNPAFRAAHPAPETVQ